MPIPPSRRKYWNLGRAKPGKNAPVVTRYLGSGGDRSGRTRFRVVIFDRTSRVPPTRRGCFGNAAVLSAVEPLVPFPRHSRIEFPTPRDNETCACFPSDDVGRGRERRAGRGHACVTWRLASPRPGSRLGGVSPPARTFLRVTLRLPPPLRPGASRHECVSGTALVATHPWLRPLNAETWRPWRALGAGGPRCPPRGVPSAKLWPGRGGTSVEWQGRGQASGRGRERTWGGRRGNPDVVVGGVVVSIRAAGSVCAKGSRRAMCHQQEAESIFVPRSDVRLSCPTREPSPR